jgi:hypothetical protein
MYDYLNYIEGTGTEIIHWNKIKKRKTCKIIKQQRIHRAYFWYRICPFKCSISWQNNSAERQHFEDASPRWHGKYLRGTTEAMRRMQISVARRNWTTTMTWWNSSIYHSAMSHLISQALRLLDSVMKNEGGTKWRIPALAPPSCSA